MTASGISAALRQRHAKDLYIGECKNGPTQSIGARPIRLDGWAFLRTWSPVTSVGYEVKVSRGDFLGDHKWRDYLALCHQFYFVAPKGLIALEELSDGVGLIEAIGKPGHPKLVTRRKAVYREPDPERYLSLVHYVLMCRVRPGGTWIESPHDEIDAAERRRRRIEEWAEWLDQEHAAEDIGRRVTKAVADALTAMRVRVSRMEAQMQGYEATRTALAALGFDPDTPMRQWGIENKIAQALGVVTPELIDTIHRAERSLETAREAFAHLQRLDVATGVSE